MKEKNNLTRLIRKKREQLKNHFYKKKATQINQAAEMRNVEEEFRLIREYKMTKRFVSKENVVRNEKLTEHFKSHFGKRHCEKQPECYIQNNTHFYSPAYTKG